MASSKLMSSSRSRNSDLSRRPRPSSNYSSSSTAAAADIKPNPIAAAANYQPQTLTHNTITNDHNNTTSSSSLPFGSMTVDGLIYDSNPTTLSDATLLDTHISLLDTASAAVAEITAPSRQKTVDEVWREIVSGESRKECKEEITDEMMTLEDFLARAGAVEEDDIKDFSPALPPPETERLSGGVFSFDPIPELSRFSSIDKVEGSIGGYGNVAEVGGSGRGVRGRGKRGRAALEPMDKAAQQRQRRMIKNRESAARSRERKQAYQNELESLAVRLEEENEQLLREKAERTEERRKQLMETVIPIVEKRRPARVLRRVRSLQW